MDSDIQRWTLLAGNLAGLVIAVSVLWKLLNRLIDTFQRHSDSTLTTFKAEIKNERDNCQEGFDKVVAQVERSEARVMEAVRMKR